MPEITKAVGQLRTLVVPFGLGRPFGAPGERAAQTEVLRALLRLSDGPPGIHDLDDRLGRFGA
jgi:hypothetical protein